MSELGKERRREIKIYIRRISYPDVSKVDEDLRHTRIHTQALMQLISKLTTRDTAFHGANHKKKKSNIKKKKT